MIITNPVRLYDILWQVKNAGPSPDNNRRTELYFAGCKKALNGNPCKNCFNPTLWDSSKCYPLSPVNIVDNLDRQKIPKYVTIVGGEPTDQIEGLVDLITILHNRGYHIMLFTWRSYEWVAEQIGKINLNKIDVMITEPYVEEFRIYDRSKDDGIHNVIGSGNQQVIVNHKGKITKYLAKDIEELKLDYSNILNVKLKKEE